MQDRGPQEGRSHQGDDEGRRHEDRHEGGGSQEEGMTTSTQQLIQIFLPLYDNGGVRFPGSEYKRVCDELMERFGGVTCQTRAPVTGLWQESSAERRQDDLVILEVITAELDRRWWSDYRHELE